MCHQYVTEIFRLIPKQSHGKEFRQVALYAERKGIMITRCGSMANVSLSDEKKARLKKQFDRGCAILFFDATDGYNRHEMRFRYFIIKTELDRLDKKLEVVRQNGLTKYKIFIVTENEPLMAMKTQIRSLSGWGGSSISEVVKNMKKWYGTMKLTPYENEQYDTWKDDISKYLQELMESYNYVLPFDRYVCS